MSREWSFETAVAFIRKWAGHDTDVAGVSDDYMEAEEFILDHKPTSPEQVLLVLDVVKENVNTGLRSDGRELNALTAIADWVQSLAEEIPLSA